MSLYRMVGWCSNCGTKDILVIYRAGDKVSDQDCPVCENLYSVRAYNQRLATAELQRRVKGDPEIEMLVEAMVTP